LSNSADRQIKEKIMARNILGGEFITSTPGLLCVTAEGRRILARIEFYKHFAGGVSLQPVSGHNLAAFADPTFVTEDEFENRPSNRTEAAIWAMRKCGLEVPGAN
jgi:hypothetical protein